MPRISSSLVLLPLVASAFACNPQSADLDRGTFTAFLSRNTSQIYIEDNIPIEDFAFNWNIDCRGIPSEDPRRDETAEGNCLEANRGISVDGAEVQHESWLNRDAFDVVHDDIDPWRGEAIMTSEGDLQITFHHRLPGGEDFRFAFVVDPEFQPRRCVEAADGSLSLQPINGDWVGQWSENMTESNHASSTYEFPGNSTDGTLFVLNSGSYQFNPDETRNTWALPPELEAGYARARFGPEEMFFISSRYAAPRAYTNFDIDDRNGADLADLYYLGTDRLPPGLYNGDNFEAEIKQDPNFIEMMTEGPELHAAETQAELLAAVNGNITLPNFTPMVPGNAWRRPDQSNSGFDRWGELHYNWVRFDQPREQLKAGEAVSGEFRLYFFGANSQSHLLVEGSFSADKVRNDTWVTRDVQAEKAEEANIVLCGG